MRKIFLFFAVILTSQYLTAQQSQKKKLFNEVETGAMANIAWNKTFKEKHEFEKNVFVSFGGRTEFTYHEILYGVTNNSLTLLNAYFLDPLKQWDTYLVYTTGIKEKYQYLGIGLEREFEVKDIFKLIPYVEFGSTLEGHTSVSVGLFLNKQFKIWVRK